MPTRNAHARWIRSLKEGGQVNFGNRLFTGAYSFTSRFEDGKVTNPEKLSGADHAPDIDLAAFMRHADAANAGCTVSQMFAGTEIMFEARLAANSVAPLGGTP